MLKQIIRIATATFILGSLIALSASGKIIFTQSRNLDVTFIFKSKSYSATISSNCQNAVARNLNKEFTMEYQGVFPSGTGATVTIGREECHLYSIR